MDTPAKYIPLLKELRQIYTDTGYELLDPLDVSGWRPHNGDVKDFRLTFYGDRLERFYAPDGFCQVLGATVCDVSPTPRASALQALKVRFNLELIEQDDDYSVYRIQLPLPEKKQE